MSYISVPRLSITGQFQANISTVNNDIRHYDLETWEPSFQEMQESILQGDAPRPVTVMNGWWSPDGDGSFRLIDALVAEAVTEASVKDPKPTDDPDQVDPAVGLYLNSQMGRSSAKLVDFDPQFQMGSQIWGLRVVLTDGTNDYMTGHYHPSAFRDINFSRSPNGGDGGASAKFTSILTDVVWTEHAEDSPTLMALKASAEANGNRLSINLMTYGLNFSTRIGSLTASIGTWEEGEPESFVAGRRFPVAQPGQSVTPQGIGYFDGSVANHTLSLDLSNALPISSDITRLANLGSVFVAVLKTKDTVTGLGTASGSVTAGIAQGATVGADDLHFIGALPDYTQPNWMAVTAGIVDLPLGKSDTIIEDHPIALVSPQPDGNYYVLIRESLGGLMVRADNFELRIDSKKDEKVAGQIPLYACQWGKKLAGQPVGITQDTKRSLGAGGGGAPNDPKKPKAKIPRVNTPPDKVAFTQTLKTGTDGWTTCHFHVLDPCNPRGYIDGQLYAFFYDLPISGASPVYQFDFMILHVRNAYHIDGMPDWDRDLAPFMQQYDNLYPIMSKGLFSLADKDVVAAHANILAFSFQSPMEDPNHMPVTRDLSDGKRQAVLRWLSQYTDFAQPPTAADTTAAMAAAAPMLPEEAVPEGLPPRQEPPHEAYEQMLESLNPGIGGKMMAMRQYLEDKIGQLDEEG